MPRSSPAVAMLWLVPAAPAQLSSEGVNSQQLLPRCRFWNSHLCNNKPRGKAVVMGGGGVALSTPPRSRSSSKRLPSGAAGRGAATQVLWDPFRQTHRGMS